MKIGIQGYEGSFHQTAAEKYFGTDIEIMPCATFREVTAAVQNGTVNAGVMAIENSIAGSILPNYALLQNSSLSVSGEVCLSIEQNLLGVRGAAIEDIKEVESHPMALLQCLNFLEETTSGARLVESVDTALSAKAVAEKGDRSVAAIASKRAAELFGLDILAANINTVKANYTRFLIIEQSDKVVIRTDADKASLYFKVSHKKGALLEALNTFERMNINMSKLQSYPIPTDPFRYLFHVDVEFEGLECFRACIEELKRHTEDFCICGIYKSSNSLR